VIDEAPTGRHNKAKGVSLIMFSLLIGEGESQRDSVR